MELENDEHFKNGFKIVGLASWLVVTRDDDSRRRFAIFTGFKGLLIG